MYHSELDTFLAKNLHQTVEKTEQIAVLLFGSSVNGSSTENSDLDLLVISRSKHSRKFINYGNLRIDLMVTSADAIHKKINAKSLFNNNVTIDILRKARVLFDRDNVAKELIDQAREMHSKGPAPITKIEREKLAADLKIMLLSHINSLSKYDLQNIEHISIARMRQDQILKRAIYSYFKEKRLWSSSFFNLAKILNDENFPQREYWKIYVASDPFSVQRLKSLEEIVNISLFTLNRPDSCQTELAYIASCK